MKKIVIFVVLFLFFASASRVAAQTPSPDPADENGPSDVILTPSGTAFKNSSADGQCVTSGAACTTANKAPGICVDNGTGTGVCTAATPTVDPLFDTGCGPNEICHIVPEKLSRILTGGQTKQKTYNFNPIGSIMSYVQNFIGEAKPNSLYHYGTELLTKFGFQVQDASYNDLTPAGLQDLTLHDIQPKRFCTTSIICIYNPFSHELMYSWKTDETWCTEDPPGRKQLIEGTRRLASFTTNYEVSTDYRLPNTVVKKAQPLPCGAKMDEGVVMDLSSLQFTKQNYYGSAITQWTVDIVAQLVEEITVVIDKAKNITKTAWQVTVPTNVFEKGSSENSMASSLAGVSFTVTPQDLVPFSYPDAAGKEALTKVGGLWNTYRNDAYDIAFKTEFPDARYETQAWYSTIQGIDSQEKPTLQAMNARQQNAQLFGNCSILPAGLQPVVFAGGECNQNWVAGASTSNIASVPPGPENTSTWASSPGGTSANPISPKFTPPSAITAGNATALVPACVLEGVAKIEGAYEGGAPCKPNECGAYGPFQITIGNCKPSCGASSCPNAAQQLGVTKDALCDFNSAAYQAARLLVGKSKYFGFPLTNADPKTQKQAIIIAGDSYYGTPKPVARLGGLSYGEWVYAHCDPTYKTHVDHTFPTPPNPL